LLDALSPANAVPVRRMLAIATVVATFINVSFAAPEHGQLEAGADVPG
jgi:hypothetical protein